MMERGWIARAARRRGRSWAGIAACLLAVGLVGAGCAAPTPSAPAAAPAARATAPPAAGPAGGTAVAPQAAASGAPAVASPGPLAQPLKVRMGSVGSLVDGPLYVALERGYFAEAGLDVEDIRAEGATRLVAPLAAGQIEVFGAAMAAGMYNAFAREIDVRLVADKGRIPPGHGNAGLVVRPDLWDSGVRSLADLRGRKVGLAGFMAGSAVTLFLGHALERQGMSLNDVDAVDLPLPDLNAGLSNGSVDAGIQVEPLLTLGMANGLFRLVQRSDELYPNLQSGFILYSAAFARNQTDAARRWMVGYLRGARDYHDAFEKNQGRAEVVDILARTTGVRETSLYDRMVSSYMDPNGRMNVQALVDAQDWFAANGYVPQKVDVQALVDYQFVDYAVSVLGEYR